MAEYLSPLLDFAKEVLENKQDEFGSFPTTDNSLKKTVSLSSLSRKISFDNLSTISAMSSGRKQKFSSCMRKVKKKMHLKTKEKESTKTGRKSLVDKVIQNSYNDQLKTLVCLLYHRHILREAHNVIFYLSRFVA